MTIKILGLRGNKTSVLDPYSLNQYPGLAETGSGPRLLLIPNPDKDVLCKMFKKVQLDNIFDQKPSCVFLNPYIGRSSSSIMNFFEFLSLFV
jgi:hypothetical protein